MFINTISESKSKTFSECALKYRFNYIDRFKESERDTSPLHFGSYIHQIFEDGYQAKTYEELDVIAKRLKESYSFSDTYLPKIKICLENFLKFNATLGESIATEMVYEIVHDEKNEIKLNGIIDRVIKGTDGGILIIDYKTSKRESTQLDLYQDHQLMGYCYALHKKMNVPIEDIVVSHYYPLTSHFVTCKYSPNQINHYLKKKVDQIWKIRKMKKADFQPMENQFCKWCGFFDMCKLHNPESLCEQRIATREKKPSWRKKKK